jgi:hypothetical protein
MGGMGTFLEQAPAVARAVATRLRLASMMRRSSLPELLRALGPETSGAVVTQPLDVVEGALSTSQRIVGRLRGVPDTCLYRSLARYAILRRAGHPVRFVMALDPKKAEGHAWLELDGAPLGEEIDPNLTVTFIYPESASS